MTTHLKNMMFFNNQKFETTRKLAMFIIFKAAAFTLFRLKFR